MATTMFVQALDSVIVLDIIHGAFDVIVQEWFLLNQITVQRSWLLCITVSVTS